VGIHRKSFRELKAGRNCERRVTQTELILIMLRNARKEKHAVGVPALLRAGIAHFGWRIFELRARGFVIENELRSLPIGKRFSSYRLIYDPELDAR
jgi:hypothetical protein